MSEPLRCAVCAGQSPVRRWLAPASLGVALVFVFGVLWANRYEYHVCDVDGCIRIDRWTGRVGWVWNEDQAEDHGGSAVTTAAPRL